MTSRVVRRPAASALVAAVALCLPLAGCTSKDTSATPQGTTEPSPSSQLAATDLPEPPEGAAADLVKQRCAASGRRWSFVGRVRNSSERPSTYTVTVAIVDKVGSTVLASGERKIEVKPGEKAKILIGPLDPKRPAADVACVPTTTVDRG